LASKRRDRPHAWTLPQIEEWAVRDGNEVLFGPQKIKIVRVMFEFEPYQEAGPGRWRAWRVDEIADAALDTAGIYRITANMIRAIRPEDFKRGNLKKRLAELL
jgi:hypothetical protein